MNGTSTKMRVRIIITPQTRKSPLAELLNGGIWYHMV